MKKEKLKEKKSDKKNKDFFVNFKKLFKNKKFLIIFFSLFFLIIWTFWGILWKDKFHDYMFQKQKNYYLDLLEDLDSTKYYSKERLEKCEDFFKKVQKWDFETQKYGYSYVYDKINSSLQSCDNVWKIRVDFRVWKVFDMNNYFKTNVVLKFSREIFSVEENADNKEIIKDLISQLKISPEVEILPEDIVIMDSKNAYIKMPLNPLTKYKIEILPTNIWTFPYFEINEFEFETPENNYMAIVSQNPVSIYKNNILPKFKLLEYWREIDEVWVKICPVGLNDYLILEKFSKWESVEQKKDFLFNHLDSKASWECFSKNIVLEKWKVNNIEFDFDQDLVWKKWMYFVTFSDSKNRISQKKLLDPVFFWLVNSHITFKFSKQGHGYFFVNDFDGNPLKNQTISVQKYATSSDYDRYDRDNEKQQEVNYKNEEFENLLLESKIIWKTDENGYLSVDLNKYFDDAFKNAYQDYRDNYSWFFIKAYDENHLSLNSSRWNAGLTDYNLGYTQWWSEDKNTQTISPWQTPRTKSHTFTDRKLYLPWEEVFIKSIIRTANLEIEENKDIEIKIFNPSSDEVFTSSKQTSEFWTISTSFPLSENIELWNYEVQIKSWEDYIGFTNFYVEVFQNPTFKTDITLNTTWLNADYFEVEKVEKVNNYRYDSYKTEWKFDLKINSISSYYNWWLVKNSDLKYKVYKQEYYSNDYWDDCFYGCYWEWSKELYTSWEWKTDENWKFSVNLPVKHSTDGRDYKYVVEIEVTDNIWDVISSSNSVIVKVPKEYKRRNNWSSLSLESKTNFYNIKENIEFTPKISNNSWNKEFNGKYILVIKKKDYTTTYVDDVKWYKRPVVNFTETVEDIRYVSWKDENYKITYKPKTTWEYIFEYGEPSWKTQALELEDIIKTKKYSLYHKWLLNWWTEYKSVVVYGETDAQNPVIDDNKIQILSDKVVYKVWEKTRFLVRLPFSKWKILWTVEQKGIIDSEWIDVNSNIFFKEIEVTDKFAPNAYVSALAFDTEKNKINEYKIWYSEIVIDKTSKKSNISIKSNKKEYLPREDVTIDLEVKDIDWNPVKSEVTLMVVDDSLISLMWNIDLNMIDKFFTKFPFNFHTSLTNVVMLNNYYFSRTWIVGWSGYWDNKWWDSAVSTRNIFKNTAYYNPEIITDKNGKASVKFTLPDNLTNFRIIALANSKNNKFWTAQEYINVRKNILVEQKSPIILRTGDEIEVVSNIFNQTQENIWVKVEFISDDLEILSESSQNIVVKANSSDAVKFKIKAKEGRETFKYTIKAIWNTSENSDIFEWIIKLAQTPNLTQNFIEQKVLDTKKTWEKILFNLWENTDLKNSKIILNISNNKISWIEKLVTSLLKYPYGCIEQTTSSTYPNVILKRFGKLFEGIVDKEKLENNINYWIDRILSMQIEDGWFAYWPGEKESNTHITPYVVRTLIDMQDDVEKDISKNIKKAVSYLEEKQFFSSDETDKAQIAWALGKAKSDRLDIELILYKLKNSQINSSQRLYYTYALQEFDAETYAEIIFENIQKLKTATDLDSKYYRNSDSNKAILLSLVIDSKINDEFIAKSVDYFYSKDLASYYFSTQTKNNIFSAFYKYLVKTGLNNEIAVNINWEKIDLWWEKIWIIKKEFLAKDFLNNDKIEIPVELIFWEKVYIDAVFEKFPEDILKIEDYQNKIKISRDIYKVDNKKEELFEWNNFDLGQLYKMVLKVEADDKKDTRNLTIEDYLPSTFLVNNSKFKTVSSDAKWKNNYYFDHKELLPNVVFLHSSYSYWDLEYTYYFRPRFAGTFIYPWVSAYKMYDPKIRANTKYSVIKVK